MDKSGKHLLILFFLIKCAERSESKSVTQLYSDLFSTYNPLVRPVLNASTKVNVTFKMTVYTLVDIDQQQESFAFRGAFTMRWKDEFLTWNPEEYQDTEQITVTADKIWKPDLLLQAVVEDSTKSDSELKVIIQNNGQIEWSALGKRVVGCKADIRTFPFDSQVCHITIRQLTETLKEVILTSEPGSILPKEFTDNGAWRYLRYSVHESVSDSQIQVISYSLHFQRLRVYYILNIILPPIILSFLSLSVFQLPPKSGEKLTLSLSILLSYSVMLGTINSSLPKVSSTVCIFSVYLLIMFFLKAMTVVSSVLVLQVEHNQDMHNSSILSVLALCKSNRTHDTGIQQKDSVKKIHQTHDPPSQQDGPLEKTLENVSIRKAILALDRMLFWMFSVLTVSATATVFIAMSVL